MRSLLCLSALAVAVAAPALAQPRYPIPRGSYERLCTDIRMEGQFLSATCRGSQGRAQSSINVLSCSTDIGVDAAGGLTCIGPGGGAPPAIRDAPPGYAVEADRYDRYDRYDRASVVLFAGRNWRGERVRIDRAMPNLDRTGLNDRIRSIRMERGSPPWIVCADAGYRGRCTTIRRSIADTREIGLGNAISSLRPAY